MQANKEPVISVIIPMYNAEKHIRRCLDSLFLQTLDPVFFEVIIVDNDSSDESVEICREYKKKFPSIRIISNKKRGVAATRNKGIDHAGGKYLFFLDSDDSISEETLENVASFFEKNDREVEIVTYPLWYDSDRDGEYNHFRYRIMNKTGIYDTEQNPYICQTTMNICVKKNTVPKMRFDEDMTVHEDQDFISRFIMRKNRIGFVKNARYNYFHHHDSLSQLKLNPLYSFSAIDKFRELLKRYPESSYLKCLFVYDLAWRLKDDLLFPYFLSEKEYEKGVKKISDLLGCISTGSIMDHPFPDYYHKFFLLKLSGRPISLLAEKDNLCIYYEKELLHRRSKIEIVISKINILRGKLIIDGFLKDAAFAFCEMPKLFMISKKTSQEIPLFISDAGRYLSKVMTNTFYGFFINESADDLDDFYFETELYGTRYDVSYYFLELSRLAPDIGRKKFFSEGRYVQIDDEGLFTTGKCNESEVYDGDDERIWLYYDCKGVHVDNGLLQFMHDVSLSKKQDDKITRYFIFNNDMEKLPDIIPKGYEKNVVRFGSTMHKKLMLKAEKIITAYIEKHNLFPYSPEECKHVAHKLPGEIIYLQHGILHATMHWKYTPEISCFDKLVISSSYEADNFNKKYNIPSERFLPVGMPRFDTLDRKTKPLNRILFAPSWRSYLISSKDNNWQPIEDVFKNSEYYLGFRAFLTDPKLQALLKKYDMYLDIKIHPIFQCYNEMFNAPVTRVRLIEGSEDQIKEEDYAVFITDFSSFVFDFVWLKRPIIYFIPDIKEFKAGCNAYRELDIPLEDAFGNYYFNAADVLPELEKILSDKCIPSPAFAKKMNDFFLPVESCMDKIYKNLIS